MLQAVTKGPKVQAAYVGQLAQSLETLTGTIPTVVADMQLVRRAAVECTQAVGAITSTMSSLSAAHNARLQAVSNRLDVAVGDIQSQSKAVEAVARDVKQLTFLVRDLTNNVAAISTLLASQPAITQRDQRGALAQQEAPRNAPRLAPRPPPAAAPSDLPAPTRPVTSTVSKRGSIASNTPTVSRELFSPVQVSSPLTPRTWQATVPTPAPPATQALELALGVPPAAPTVATSQHVQPPTSAWQFVPASAELQAAWAMGYASVSATVPQQAAASPVSTEPLSDDSRGTGEDVSFFSSPPSGPEDDGSQHMSADDMESIVADLRLRDAAYESHELATAVVRGSCTGMLYCQACGIHMRHSHAHAERQRTSCSFAAGEALLCRPPVMPAVCALVFH